MSGRWIAAIDKMELSERQPDGSYRVAYKMQPIEEYEADVRLGYDVLARAKEQVLSNRNTLRELALEMGSVIRRMDETGEHSDFWTMDGDYIIDGRFPR